MFKKNYFLFFLAILIFASYILGFIINENSIGSGGYNGDLVWIWDNFEIFKSENIFSALKSEDFFGNRTPLLYILNFYFNPFIEDIYTYRLSIFIFSILGFCVYYLCLKTKFKNLNLETALFLSSVILLSPFYRTSSFWGLEIQYGIISALLSFYFFKKNEKIESANYKNIFLTILFSSATVYFDVKLVFVPLLIFFKYLTAKIEIEKKIIILFLYFIFAIPYFLLIFMWSGLVPKATQVGNPLQGTHLGNSNIHLVNLLFATNILGFYLFPILIFKKKLISDIKKIPNLFNLFLLIIFCLYLFYFINYNLFDYTDVFTKQEGGYKNLYGLGYSLKVSNLLFDQRYYSFLLNLAIYVISFLIILLVINSKVQNLLIISFFYLISLFLFPLMQEYFDPYIFIIGLLILKNEYHFNLVKCTSVFLYFSIFLLSSYYFYL